MPGPRTLVLSGQDVRKIVRRIGLDAVMDQLIDELEEAFRTHDATRAEIPVRDGFDYELPSPGLLEWMPIRTDGRVTVKIVGYHPSNPRERRLPTVVSTISAYESGTGHLAGIVDGTLLTAMRTGAASAVASRALAAPGSRTLGLIGCGTQAVTQLHAISRLFPLERVLVHDVDPESANSFASRVDFVPVDVEVAPLARVIGQADILCTATSVEPGAGPVFEDQVVQPWIHVNAVGSDFPGKTELPLALLRRSFVTPDFDRQAVNEGECQQLTPSQIGPPLAEVVAEPGRFRHLRRRASVFDSTGWALEDHVVMDLFLRLAARLGLGNEIEIEIASGDPHDPYHTLKPTTTRTESVA